jgi:hypothetical protein
LDLRSNRTSRRATLLSVVTDVCLTPRFMLVYFCRILFNCRWTAGWRSTRCKSWWKVINCVSNLFC